jgi:hypothetical protein
VHSYQLREGIADLEMYRGVMESPNISSEIKESVRIGYKNEAAISYLTEQIVGQDFYYYCHAKGGEELLAAKFDNISGKVGGAKYVEIYCNMSDGEKIKALENIVKERAPENAQSILDNVERIRKEGKYDV